MWSLSLSLVQGLLAASLASAALVKRQEGPVDPSTTKDCKFFDTAMSQDYDCAFLEDIWAISHLEFVTWNPSVKEDCSGIKIGNSYCVEGPKVQSPTTTKPTNTPTSTTAKPPVSTCNPNAPDQVQPGATCGCTKWHLVKAGDNCPAIIDAEKISTADFYRWNPGVGSDCRTLWAGYNVCVTGPGATKPPTSTTTTKTPEETCNPRAPQPVQPGVICGCNKWHLVKTSSTTCQAIIDYDHISADDFYKWNPKVGRDCRGLWQGYNVCVGVPGSTPVTTTHKPVETCNPNAPQPVQPGTVCHCKKWHYVKNSSTTCDAIIKYDHISPNDFYKWNPKVGRDCKGLWQGYNVCVGV